MTAANRLTSIRIITADIRRLVTFCEMVTGVEATWATDEFAELTWPAFTMAIGSTATLALFGGDIAQAATNRSVIIEFMVDDVDSDHRRILTAAPATIVAQPPTTMPWGNRSLLLRDHTTSSQPGSTSKADQVTYPCSRPVGTVTHFTDGTGRVLDLGKREDLYVSGVRRFRKAIRTGSSPAASGMDGAWALSFALAAHRSAASGTLTEVDVP